MKLLAHVVAVVGQNAAAQDSHAGPPFFLRKRKTVADGGGHSVDVVGVDGHGFPQLFGGPGKLAQHQDAVFIGAGGHKLLGHQVHSVPQGSDQHQIGRAVESDQLGLGYGAVKVVYGHRVYGRVGAVDPAHQLVQILAVLLVGVDPGARGHHDLDHAHLVPQPGLPLQQSIHGQHAPRQSLGVIEAVHPQDQLAPATLLPHGLRLGQHRFPVGQPAEFGGIDADGEDSHEDLPFLEGQHLSLGFHAQNQRDGPREMAQVGEGVESDQIGSQDALQHLAAPGEGSGKTSEEGKGMCRKNPILAWGIRRRSMAGTRVSW